MVHLITYDDFLASEQEIKMCQAVDLIVQLAIMDREMEELRRVRWTGPEARILEEIKQ